MAELTGSENDHQPDFSHETYQTDLGSDADGRSIMTTVESSGKSQSSTYMEISIDTINTSADKSQIQAKLDDSSSQLMNTSTDEIKLGPDGDNANIEKQPLEKKARASFIPGDVSSVDSGKLTTDSLSSSGSKHGSTSGSSSNKSPQHQGKDTSRKDKEREEKIKQQREKLAEERQKKIEEMKEQQKMAQEKREKQLELRRMKIDELRRRDEERRTAVEERRKKQEEVDKARREAILQKSAERITRYEQWKASGRKGGVRGPYGFGSRAPREVCQPLDRRRSSSHSTLYRRSPNGSDSDTYRPQRRAVSACSVVRRHCCIDINKLNGYPGSSPPSKILSMSTSVLYHKRSPEFSSSGNLSARDRPDSLLALNTIPENSRSFLAPSGPPPTRPKSTFNLSNREHVKMRDKARAERKPRPKSVAGSIPSFIQMESTTSPKTRDQKTTSRSKSTDRIARDRQKAVPSPRATSKREKDDINKQEKSAISEDKKDVKKRLEIKRPTPEKKKPDVKKTEDNKKDAEKGDKPSEKPSHKISQKTLDRLSTPKQSRDKSETRPETPTKEHTPVKVTKKSVKIIAPTPPPRKSKTPKQKEKRIKESPVKVTTKDTSVAEAASEEKEAPSSVKEVSEIKEPSPEPTTVDETVSTVQVSEEKVSTVITSETVVTEDKVEESPREDIKSESEEEQHEPPETATPIKQEQKVADLKKAEKPSTPVATPQTEKEKEMMEYKAKLAEKRRQAREKAEREAELERQRQEELERLEQERLRQEEEEQRRMEEEAHRLAEEARKQEEERLRKAIEAEEQRKKEEAERLEKERLAKEEADRKAKEEAERAEIEKQEKLKKEEEERQERKKRLEMIMKRVKSDTPLSSPASSPAIAETKPTDSPNKSLTSSPSKSSYASSESLSDDKSQENGVTFSLDDKKETLDKEKLLETPKFKSPLLQKLVESKQSQNGGSETPKFKSPLLQNLMSKKAGSRLGLDRSDGEKSDSEATSDSEKYGDTVDSSEELEDRVIEESTSDTTETVDISDSTLRMDSSVDMSESLMEKSDTGSDMFSEQKDSSVIKSSDSSDILVTINGPSQNGDMGGHYQKELVDSSISMRTVDSLGTSVTTDSSLYGSLIDSQTASSYSAGGEEQVSLTTTSTAHTASGEFEEYIDLNVNNRNTIINNSEDLLNFNSIDNKLDNITTGEDSHPKPPIIAFEDNATRRQEVTGLEVWTSCHEEPKEFMLTNGIVMDTNGIIIDTNHSASDTSAAVNYQTSCSPDVVATNVQSVPAVSSHHNNDNVVTIHSHESNHVLSSISAALKLEDDPQTQNKMDVLWQQFETAMLSNCEKVRDRLEKYGIGEGDEDSESEEGQIWRMVQGDSPYTLELV